jgi:hypothetical protein
MSEAAPRRRAWISPAGFLVGAALLAALYAVAHLAGLRAYTTFLSGSAPPDGVDPFAATALGLVYVALHFACVLGAPVLVIAAGLLALDGLRRSRS